MPAPKHGVCLAYVNDQRETKTPRSLGSLLAGLASSVLSTFVFSENALRSVVGWGPLSLAASLQEAETSSGHRS